MTKKEYSSLYLIELLQEAAKPFAGIVGKDSAPLTIIIGNDTWSGILKGSDLSKLRKAYHISQGFLNV